MGEYGYTITTIREVFSYANRFRETLFVIHIAHDVITSTHFDAIAKDISLLHGAGIRIIIVPGVREGIDRVLHAQKIEIHHVQGQRITPQEAITFVEMVSFDISSKIMTFLANHNLRSVIGNWVKAGAWGVQKGIDFLETGKVESVHTNHLHQSITHGAIPIVPCIGWNRTGHPYNVRSYELATVISTHMQANKLIFLTYPKDLQSLRETIPHQYQGENNIQIPVSGLSRIRESHSLLKEAHQAIRGGVLRAHILDGQMDGAILLEIFSSGGVGAMVYTDEYERIRVATREDLPAIMRLFQPLMDQDVLIHRDEEDMLSQIDNFFVYETDDTVEGTAGLRVYEEQVGELVGLAVNHSYGRKGTGKKLVEYIMQRARKQKLQKLYVLTTHAIDLFLSMGFTSHAPESLPAVRQQECRASGRNSRILGISI